MIGAITDLSRLQLGHFFVFSGAIPLRHAGAVVPASYKGTGTAFVEIIRRVSKGVEQCGMVCSWIPEKL